MIELKLTQEPDIRLRTKIFLILKHSGWQIAGDRLYICYDPDPKKITLLRMIL